MVCKVIYLGPPSSVPIAAGSTVPIELRIAVSQCRSIAGISIESIKLPNGLVLAGVIAPMIPSSPDYGRILVYVTNITSNSITVAANSVQVYATALPGYAVTPPAPTGNVVVQPPPSPPVTD